MLSLDAIPRCLSLRFQEGLSELAPSLIVLANQVPNSNGFFERRRVLGMNSLYIRQMVVSLTPFLNS